MRFVSLRRADGATVAGLIVGDQVADLSHPSCRAWLGGAPPSVLHFVEQGLAGWAARLAPFVAERRFDPDALQPLDGALLAAPLRPGKVVGAAFNYRDALAERGMAPPAEPVTFVRAGSTVIGPGDAILVPPDVGNVGYEAELAAVIGRRAIAVPRERALQHVAGWCAHNDVSGSGLIQQDRGRFVRGKNLPATAPLGPWLATADELPDPQDLGVRLWIGDRPLQDGNTRDMLFGVAELIAHISAQMPLEPGDVIATGTPAGVAGMHQPTAWLQPGQTVCVEVQGLGRLINPVRTGVPFLEP